MELTAENLERIILQFYQSDPSTQASAHQWLTAAQQSQSAWFFVWELLSPKKSPEVQFFAATTLHSKVARQLAEVPADEYPTFKNKLMCTLSNYCNGPKIVLNRLCIAMAAFILQVAPEHWENPVSTLVDSLCTGDSSAGPEDQAKRLLLELLTVIPEEFTTMHIAQGRRGLVRNELQKSFPQVSTVLVRTLEWGSVGEVENGVRCARAWLQIGVPLPNATGDGSLAPLLLRIACNTPWGASASCALEALGDLATHPDTHHHPRSVQELMSTMVPAIGELARRSVSAGNHEAACSAYTLLASIGESHIRLLLTRNQNGVPNEMLPMLLELLLECTGTAGQYPQDETLSAIPFGFWYILQDEVVSSEPGLREEYVRLLSPVYARLADTLLLKSVLPGGRLHNQGRPMNQEEAEVFRCYRTDIADTMTYCHGILKQSLSELLLSRLAEQLEVHRQNPAVWHPLEACLHALLSIAETARNEPSADEKIARFLSAVGSLPLTANPRLLATALEVVGAHAEWLNDNPQAVGGVLQLLVHGLADVQTAPSATMALKDLSRDCSAGLLPFAHHVLSASQDAISRGILRPAETVRLTFVIGRVLSGLPVPMAAPYLNNLLVPCLDKICELNNMQPSTSTKASILVCLKMVAALFSAMDIHMERPSSSWVSVASAFSSMNIQLEGANASWASILLPLLQRVFPILEQVSSKWYMDEDIMQAVCLVLKHAATTLMDDITPALPSILQLLVNSYLLHQHPAMLDLSRHLIVMFGANKGPEGTSEVGNLLEEMCRATLCLPDNTNPISSERVDILEAFFSLLSQVARRNPSAVSSLSSPVDVATLMRAGTQAMSLPETPLVKSASSFLSNLIMHCSDEKEIQTAIDNHGEALVESLLLCIGGGSPRALTDHVADVLLALSKKCFDRLCNWLNRLLLGPLVKDFPSQRVSRQQKELFVQMVLRERSNKRRLQEVVREFGLLCKGLSLNQQNSGLSPGILKSC